MKNDKMSAAEACFKHISHRCGTVFWSLKQFPAQQKAGSPGTCFASVVLSCAAIMRNRQPRRPDLCCEHFSDRVRSRNLGSKALDKQCIDDVDLAAAVRVTVLIDQLLIRSCDL